MNIQPTNERKFRLECLQLAAGTLDTEGQVDLAEVIKRAETLYRYVIEGAAESATVVSIRR